MVRARVAWHWYLFVLLGVPSLYLLALLLVPGALQSYHGGQSRFLLSYLVALGLAIIAEGPLGEEPGWRGFALPRMQPRFGPLRGTLLLGLLWGFWHLPDFATTNQRGGPGANYVTLASIDFPLFILYAIAVSLVFTWVFNHTGSSVFIAILLHASINTFPAVMALFPAPIVAGTNLPVLVGVAGPLLLILLTRGRLGYDTSKKLPRGAPPREASPTS
jgi:membrane protease YdiL (CAAX protease family)